MVPTSQAVHFFDDFLTSHYYKRYVNINIIKGGPGVFPELRGGVIGLSVIKTN